MINEFLSLKELFKNHNLEKPEFISQAHQFHRRLYDYCEVLEECDIDQIRITKSDVNFVVQDMVFVCPRMETRAAPLEIMNFGAYEPKETEVLDRLVDGENVLLDIGANIGWFAVRLKKKFPSLVVHAFEPMPQAYSYLQRNISSNLLGEGLYTYNYGLSESAGIFDFFIDVGNGTNASLLNVANSASASKVTCFTSTLDNWCLATGTTPDVIKCDVEGAEFLVYKGGFDSINEHKPKVFTELLRKWAKPYGYHPNDVLDFFEEIGYLAYAVSESSVSRVTRINEQTTETNYVFLHREKHKLDIQRLNEMSV